MKLYTLTNGCIFFVLSVVAASAHASSAVVTFDGSLSAGTCKVTVNGEVDPVIEMPEASLIDLAKGVASPKVPISIVLDKCGDAASAVSVGYMGNRAAPSDNSSMVFVQSSVGLGAAKGVGVRISDQSLGVVAVNRKFSYEGLAAVGDKVTIVHEAEYVILDSVAVEDRRAGTLNIAVTYVVRYE